VISNVIIYVINTIACSTGNNTFFAGVSLIMKAQEKKRVSVKLRKVAAKLKNQVMI